MKNRKILLSAALVAGAVIGHLAGSHVGETTDSSVRGGNVDVRAVTEGELVATDVHQAGDGNASNEVEGRGRQPISSSRAMAMMSHYQGMTSDELRQEVGRLRDMPHPDHQFARMFLFIRWGEVDPHAALEHVGAMSGHGKDEVGLIYKGWASMDPEKAARFQQSIPRKLRMQSMWAGNCTVYLNDLRWVVVREWAKQNPQAALDWLNENMQECYQGEGWKKRSLEWLPLTGHEMVGQIISEMAWSDPGRAFEMTKGPGVSDVGCLYGAVAAGVAARDFGKVQSWLNLLPEEHQDAAVAEAIGALAKTDLDGAAAHAVSMAAGEARDRAVHHVVRVMADDQAAEAGEWLKQHGSAEARKQNVELVVDQWMRTDPKEALDYAYSYDAGDIRDDALAYYVRHYDTNIPSNLRPTPAEMVQVAESISRESLRTQRVGYVLLAWQYSDLEAAKAYAKTSPYVCDRQKKRLLSQ